MRKKSQHKKSDPYYVVYSPDDDLSSDEDGDEDEDEDDADGQEREACE